MTRERVFIPIVFLPGDDFCPEPGSYYPTVGARGTIIARPQPGTFGGSVLVQWNSGEKTEFGGRNSESLVPRHG